MTGPHDFPARDANDHGFHREQLSAMMDGALSADETRFLLRRMEHDDALADCWERWQLYGDALRGHAGRALPADFARRVGRAIADDQAVDTAPVAMTASGGGRPLLRWGGGAALAASVALAAIFVGREPASAGTQPATEIAAIPIQASPSLPVLPAAGEAPVPQPVGMSGDERGPEPAPVTEAAVALAAVTAAAAAAESRNARPRVRSADRAVAEHRAVAEQGPVVAANAPSAVESQRSPTIAPDARIIVKPWPRSLIPGASAAGGLTAGFGDGGASALPPALQPRSEFRFEPPDEPESAQAVP